jgi:L-alanine-DL-glutamate epimerase-like enolase superfamily enzyme
MARTHVVDYLQPSAIKSGGVSTLRKLSQECAGTAVHCSPQSAFFGPGFLATLHVLAAQEDQVHVERLFCSLAFTPYSLSVPCVEGSFQLSDAPGLGADPEIELMAGAIVRSA